MPALHRAGGRRTARDMHSEEACEVDVELAAAWGRAASDGLPEGGLLETQAAASHLLMLQRKTSLPTTDLGAAMEVAPITATPAAASARGSPALRGSCCSSTPGDTVQRDAARFCTWSGTFPRLPLDGSAAVATCRRTDAAAVGINRCTRSCSCIRRPRHPPVALPLHVRPRGPVVGRVRGRALAPRTWRELGHHTRRLAARASWLGRDLHGAWSGSGNVLGASRGLGERRGAAGSRGCH